MPLPLLALVPVITGALSSVTAAGLMSAASATLFAGAMASEVSDWLDSGSAGELIADALNARLSAAGVDLVFPAFNPATDEGRDIVKRVLEGFVVARVNAKTGAEFTDIASVTQENFLGEVGKTLAKRVNRDTGAQITSVWPLEKLQGELHSEVLRQFDNRGRYNGGALFRSNALAQIKAKIAAKHPALMAQVKAVEDGGYYGPARDEKHQRRRDLGRARQARYKQSHQQVWQTKTWIG